VQIRAQQWYSRDPGDLSPIFGLPRIILTFEVWDIVVNLRRFNLQMLAHLCKNGETSCFPNISLEAAEKWAKLFPNHLHFCTTLLFES
jgi:hypothetical protein